jgi:dihydrofolate reductase/thymidylate synthase
VVLSRNPSIRNELAIPEEVLIATSLVEALELISTSKSDTVEEIFVIGGQAVYTEAICSPYCKTILMTSVESSEPIECDTFFPPIPAQNYRLVARSTSFQEGGITYRFTKYESIPGDLEFDNISIRRYSRVSSNEEEMQYLHLIDDIIKTGVRKGDRTGTGTISKFGVQMRFSLRDNVFPLLTTKKVFWRGVAEELLWFVKGSTNGKELSDKGIHIWDGNGSREFLDKLGHTDREEGMLALIIFFDVVS